MSMLTAPTAEVRTFAVLQAGLRLHGDAELNSNYLNGVSTFDLVLMSKHILGVQPWAARTR